MCSVSVWMARMDSWSTFSSVEPQRESMSA